MQSWLRMVIIAVMAVCSGGLAAGEAGTSAPRADPDRGELLYTTVCAACHSEQVHWRDQRLVGDWPSLLYQVTRWQAVAGQTWSAEDIADVAAYLNRGFYRMPCPVPGCGAGASIGNRPPAGRH